VLLNFDMGTFGDSPAQSRRTLGNLAEIFAGKIDEPARVVYETFGCPGEVEGPARLLYATTVLQPGDVEGEFFMTRGHFHTNPERGELMFTLRGTGALLLMDREGKTWTESMEPGSTHDIDGHHAHRVVNTGDQSLIFLVAWMSDCGHDYESIKQTGFGTRLMKS
jgi:glucose-6-phosphate isomerase, archaeal